MNNRIKLLAAVLIIATIVFAFVIGASSVLAGDINKDGKVQAGDARLALRHVAKLDTLKGEQFNIADMDGDGKVNASDARMILRIAAKLDPGVRCPPPQPPLSLLQQSLQPHRRPRHSRA